MPQRPVAAARVLGHRESLRGDKGRQVRPERAESHRVWTLVKPRRQVPAADDDFEWAAMSRSTFASIRSSSGASDRPGRAHRNDLIACSAIASRVVVAQTSAMLGHLLEGRLDEMGARDQGGASLRRLGDHHTAGSHRLDGTAHSKYAGWASPEAVVAGRSRWMLSSNLADDSRRYLSAPNTVGAWELIGRSTPTTRMSACRPHRRGASLASVRLAG